MWIHNTILLTGDTNEAGGDIEVRIMLADIKPQLMDQLRAAVAERAPADAGSELLGPGLGRSCRRAWIHFNLREVGLGGFLVGTIFLWQVGTVPYLDTVHRS